MRTDLSVVGADGVEHDLAVVATEGTTFGDVSGELARACGAGAPLWSGLHRLHPGDVIGRGALHSGSVLTPRRAAGVTSTAVTRLVVVGGPGAGRDIEVVRGNLVIGRAPDCDLVLPDARASRRHALVTVDSARAEVSDLGSTHGTTLDGVAVTGTRALEPGAVLRAGHSFLSIDPPAGPRATLTEAPGATLVHRPARADAGGVGGQTFELPPAPPLERAARTPWAAALLPALAGGVLAVLLHSAQFLAFAALGPLAVLATAAGERRWRRRDRRRADGEYRDRLAVAERGIAAAVRAETLARRSAQPDPATLTRIACMPTARLWERRGRDTDLLRVRLGLGSLPSTTAVSTSGERAPAATLAAVPCTVDLAAGSLGVALPAARRAATGRWILTQLAVLCGPDDVEVALLLEDDRGWHWARWLPHLGDRIAVSSAEATELLDELASVVAARRGAARRTGPRIVVVVDGQPGPGVLPRLAEVAADPAAGVTAVHLADRVADLPASCTRLVTAGEALGDTLLLGATEVVADGMDVARAERIARALAPLRDASSDPAAALPRECRLAAIAGVDPPDPDAVVRRWHRTGASLTALLGLGAAGAVTVDLDRDGPHLLLAGTTGSGKSELLQTIVAGLALDHPPSRVTFLLVDYKGGAAFAECAGLPHTVGLVTDLDDRLTRRVLSSLDSEVRRREALLAETGERDLAGYRAGGRQLPDLVIAVDEFATLADELPDFVPGLVGIAQRGRSLGLHLILATQRPAGVVSPEIRANVSARIALRVTGSAESVDVIDTPAAASVPRRCPGRGWLRIGTEVTAFQAARVAGPAGDPAVRVIALDRWRRGATGAPDSGESDLHRIVTAVTRAAAGDPAPRRPWLPPLPDDVDLDDVPAAPPATRVPVGLVDRPDLQRQDPLAIDLAAGGTVLLVGSPRTGRTTALLTAALAAAERLSPAELHVHALDATGAGLTVLARLPHAGTIVDLTTDAPLAQRLVRRLQQDLTRRRGDAGPLPALLLVVDGWEALLDTSDHLDGGRTADRLLAMLRDVEAARATVLITGGRGCLAPRLAAQAGTRLVLPLHDRGDYAQAGIDARTVPEPRPGRGVRAGDGVHVQLARRRSTGDAVARIVARWSAPHATGAAACPPPIRLRPLPAAVALHDLPTTPGRLVLGVGGDDAGVLSIDPHAGAARLLIAGPPRSGRSTALRTLLHQAAVQFPGAVAVAAPSRSPLAALARSLDVPLLVPPAAPGAGTDAMSLDPALPPVDAALLLVDDLEAFADTGTGDGLAEWARGGGRRAVVGAGRSDALAVAFRGLGAELRQAGCGILLRPAPVDGPLLGVALPRSGTPSPPGRGLLVPDPAWGLGDESLALQVAVP